MKGIAEFFARIQNKQAQEIMCRKAGQEALKTVGIDVEIGDIGFKGSTLTLKRLSQTAKTQLFIKKAFVLKEIAARPVGRTITEIRF